MTEWFAAVGLAPGMGPAAVDARLVHLFGPAGAADRRAMLDALDLMDGQFNAHGVEMTRRYSSSAVIADAEPATDPDPDSELHHRPSTRAGRTIPHVWLTRGEARISTLDVCAYDRFTLVVGAGGAAWHDAADRVASELDVDIDAVTVSLGHDVSDAYGDWARRRDVGDDGAVLVRPDRIIAWRSDGLPDDPTGALRAAMSRLLDRPTGA